MPMALNHQQRLICHENKETKPGLLDPEMVPEWVPLWVREDLGVMKLKGYFTLPRASEWEPYDQMQFAVILGTPPFWGGYN